MVKCPHYNILLKECKGMHKMMQLISKILNKKNMLPFMQCMFIMSISWKKITWKFQSFENLKQRATREVIHLLNNSAKFLYPLCSKTLALDACHTCMI
jgi:hypothetical protein